MKVAIYSRTSTDRQQSGLEAQRRALEDYCKSKGIDDYIIYEDSGISGTKSSRPELDKMMSEVRAGNIGMVIVYSFSRFARSTKFLIDTLEEFGGLNVGFISLTENLDLTTPIGKAMFSIIAALATLERDLTRQRVINGLVNARAKGKILGRPQTVQYELIIALREKGFTYRQISEVLKVGQGSITKALKSAAQK
jgi:DNA invertase Pin-like site-specific DNA recombinase